MAKKPKTKAETAIPEKTDAEIEAVVKDAEVKAKHYSLIRALRNKFNSDQTVYAQKLRLRTLAKKNPVVRNLLDERDKLAEKSALYDALEDADKSAAVTIKELKKNVVDLEAKIVELTDKIADAIGERDKVKALLEKIRNNLNPES